MKLYHFPISPNSRRVVAVLHHLQLPCELQAVDLTKGEHLQADFLKLNPNHMIPTLVDDGFNLWESNAIMQYLGSKVPNNSLWPIDAKVQADISRWQFWQVAHFGRAAGILLFEHGIKGLFNLGAASAEEITKGEELFHRFAKVLETHLIGREWLVGDAVTLADLSVGSWVAVEALAKLPLAEYTEIQRWYRNVEQLPAWKSSAL